VKKVVIIAMIIIANLLSLQAQREIRTRDHAVELSAESISGITATITISWAENDSHTGEVFIHRKEAHEKYFPEKEIAILEAGTNRFTDVAVEAGKRYNYQVKIKGSCLIDSLESDIYAFGYIESGVEAEEIHNLGKVLLIVDETVAADLEYEINRLDDDMVAEGWTVVKRLAPRAENFDRGKVDVVKSIIINEYEKDTNLNTVFLLGRIPIAYAGRSNSDGHHDHHGAWASDMYYGDIDNKYWSDITVFDSSAVDRRNHNIPEDGKFDNDNLMESSVLLELELAVGRVDLYNMPIYHREEWGNDGEIELLRQYLDKDHAWRTGKWNDIPYSAIIGNHFGPQIEGFASSGWRNFSSIVGSANVTKIGWQKWLPELDSNKHLFAYGCGGGGYQHCSGIGTIEEFVKSKVHAPFVFLFGSYFGDWDVENNLLRTPLCSVPYGLTCCWDGRPHWYFHELVMGKPFGHCVLTSQNNAYLSENKFKRIYFPNILQLTDTTGVKYLEVVESGRGGRQMSFLGDPTLRLDSYKSESVTDLQAVQEGSIVNLNWVSPMTDNIYHFNIYRRYGIEESWEQLNPEPLTAESFSDISPGKKGNITYQVRVATLMSCNTGSYYQVGRSPIVNIDFEPTQGVDEFDLYYRVAVSPNPANDKCEIFVNVKEASDCDITVYDSIGNLICSFAGYITEEKVFIWDMTDMYGNEVPKGVYMIQVNNSRGSKTLKILKK
jgi:hypothetical protein